ncbi:hypothetical protein MTO96_029885 [Rhipicephalus appendiculatus]
MNSSTFYGIRNAREKTTTCDIPSGSEDSDLSDSDDDYLPALTVALPPQVSDISVAEVGVVSGVLESLLNNRVWPTDTSTDDVVQ